MNSFVPGNGSGLLRLTGHADEVDAVPVALAISQVVPQVRPRRQPGSRHSTPRSLMSKTTSQILNLLR